MDKSRGEKSDSAIENPSLAPVPEYKRELYARELAAAAALLIWLFIS
jgi:hypothetical protein